MDHYRRQTLFLQAALAGLIALVIAPAGYFTVAGQTTFGFVMLVVAVIGGAAFVGIGAAHGYWLAKVVEHGIHSIGCVLSAGASGLPGEVVGQLRVEHSVGSFVGSFKEDASWATQLAPGSLVDVVVDRDRPKLLLVLGPRVGVEV